jgi:hypothetical protein
VRHLVGTWKSAEDKIPRGTPLDEQVFGRGAFAVRNVTLAIRPTGEGTLRVHTAIIGHNGKVFVPELIDVRIGLAGPLAPVPNRFEPTVSVVAAMKRELDPPYDRWSIEGARLVIDLPAIASPELNVQFDTRDGRDGFGGTLTRQN